MKERYDKNCTHLVEIATDSALSQLLRLGLYTEAFLTEIAHQTNETESVVEYLRLHLWLDSYETNRSITV